MYLVFDMFEEWKEKLKVGRGCKDIGEGFIAIEWITLSWSMLNEWRSMAIESRNSIFWP